MGDDGTSRTLLLKIPSELHVSIMGLLLLKHKRIYGNLNKEIITALEDHVEREQQRLKVTIKAS